MPRVISDELYHSIVEYGRIYDRNYDPNDDDYDPFSIINDLLTQLRNDAIDVIEWTGEEPLTIVQVLDQGIWIERE